jgi:hypothetical protein
MLLFTKGPFTKLLNLNEQETYAAHISYSCFSDWESKRNPHQVGSRKHTLNVVLVTETILWLLTFPFPNIFQTRCLQSWLLLFICVVAMR